MSKLLFNEQPLIVSKELAVKFGLLEGILIQQIHYWIEINKTRNHNFCDGNYWVYNTYEQWQKNDFPFVSVDTIKRAIRKLESAGIIVSANYNKLKIDKTKWYRIDYNMLETLNNKDKCNLHRPTGQTAYIQDSTLHQALPENTTEISSKNNSYNDNGGEFDKQSSPHDIKNHSRDSVEFYNWYVAKCYPHYKGRPHPLLKKVQKETVLDSLDGFISENSLDLDDLGKMAEAYFQKVKTCDHNINHFATEGIMENRFYEACY